VNAALSFSIGGVRTEVQFVEPPLDLNGDLTVADTNTAGLCPGSRNLLKLPPGEQAKVWESVNAILARCAEAGLGRDSTIAGVGGGVICDLTAFAASIYMRGCGLVLAPTTLLAMVDASLGGKTGIDFQGFKNLVGTFYPAARLVVCPAVLAGLPEREYLSGLAEVIKSGIIGDARLFALLEERHDDILDRDPSVLEELIRRSLAVKGKIVEEDPREHGRRAFLNLGHTFGHALESASGFSGWTHGEAVAWGMGRALAAGVILKVTDTGFARRARALLELYGYRLEAGVGLGNLAPAFARDKKRRGGKVRLVLAAGLEDMVIREVEDRDLDRALADGQG
jgi:3-dehydroquinate synthase